MGALRDTSGMERFHDKVAIVTGGGSGIGHATAPAAWRPRVPR